MYKVRWHINNTYQVIRIVTLKNEVREIVDFQGSLSDCESYIRLHNEGYLE